MVNRDRWELEKLAVSTRCMYRYGRDECQVIEEQENLNTVLYYPMRMYEQYER
jgi:hypothetical protein